MSCHFEGGWVAAGPGSVSVWASALPSLLALVSPSPRLRVSQPTPPSWLEVGLVNRQVLRRPAASDNPAGQSSEVAALGRIADALERIAEARGPRPESPVALPAGPAVVPEVLMPLVAAIDAAGPGSTAGGIAAALGYPEGHPRRGITFAVLQGLLATVRPGLRLGGLDSKRQSGENARLRARNFFEKRQSIQVVALFAGVSLATVIQGLSRDFIHSERLRGAHSQRFLGQLAECWEALASL